MNPLKILHIVAGADHGGAETFCLDAIVALHEAGVKQHVITRPHKRVIETLKSLNIPFDTMSFSFTDKLWGGPSLIRARVKSFAPSLVHAWMGRAASFVPPRLGVPVLGWFGGYYNLKRYKNCTHYMGVTRDLVRYIGEASGKPERTFLAHTFGTLPPAPPLSRADFKTPEDACVVLLLSRMHPKKGVDTLLKAAQRLPGVYVWMAGDGPNINEYKSLCTQMGLDDRVRFLGWRDDRAALLAAADICALPSRYEPFGTVMAEAWHAGVPLVAARAAGPSAYVEHGVNGLLCDIDDDKTLAENIKSILENPGLRTQLIEGGRKTGETLFSRQSTVTAMMQAYISIMSDER